MAHKSTEHRMLKAVELMTQAYRELHDLSTTDPQLLSWARQTARELEESIVKAQRIPALYRLKKR
jgi:hypothetical protein